MRMKRLPLKGLKVDDVTCHVFPPPDAALTKLAGLSSGEFPACLWGQFYRRTAHSVDFR